jgi:hypothetical protein
MTIDVCMSVDELADTRNPQAVIAIDLAASSRNFERMLAAELERFYPTAQIVVCVAFYAETSVRVGEESRQAAGSVEAGVRYAMEKLFIEGRFWVDKESAKGC